MGRTCALALTALIALAALPCPAAVQFVQLDDNGAEWMTALGVANSAVSYWNARRLEQSAVDLRGLLAASKSVDVEDHYHLTMDVSGRNTGTLMMEAYKEDGNWVFLVSSAIKNAKATFPETRTSENDAWRRVSPSETKVAEAVKEANVLLLATAAFLSLKDIAPNNPPVLDQVLHAEFRRRDIGEETTTLRTGRERATEAKSQAKLKYLDSQEKLVEKLSFKKLALEGGGVDELLMLNTDKEISDLGNEITSSQSTETLSGQHIERLKEAGEMLEKQAAVQAEKARTTGVDSSWNTYYFLILRYKYTSTSMTVMNVRRHVLMLQDYKGDWSLVSSMVG